MRITNRMMITEFNRNLSSNLERMLDYQRMLSTGKRITRASDDPIGIIDSLRLRTRINEAEKYVANISEGKSWMESTDSAMSKMTEVLHRARELALYGVNGTMSAESKAAVAAEIKQLVEQAKTIANTAHGDKYIFGGTNYTERAYDGRCWWGNDGEVSMEIGVGVAMDINSQMRELFMGNNYYDIIHDRMPEGRFSVSMSASPRTRIDNDDPNPPGADFPNGWQVRTPGAAAVFDGFDPAADIVSTLPASGGTHNIGARVKLEVAEVVYDNAVPPAITEVKVNVSYRQHDSITGESFDDTQQVILSDMGGGVFGSASPVVTGKGKVTIDPLRVDTGAAGFAVGATCILENTPLDGSGNPSNLGSTTLLQAEWQRKTASGQGLVDSSPGGVVAAAGYNNFNGSFLFEVTQVDNSDPLNPRVEVKVKVHLMDKFSGEHTYYDNNERIWLKTNGADNYVDIYEKVVKTAYQDMENLTVPEGESPYKYYDFMSRFQFSQLKLDDISHFTAGDRWVVETTPPLNEPAAEDHLITVAGSGANQNKHWVLADYVVENSSSLAFNSFYLDEKGNSSNSSMDIPTAGLNRSPEVINWKTDSTYMTGITGDGLPADYKYTLNTATGLAAAGAGFQPNTGAPGFFGLPVSEHIQKGGVVSLTNHTETVQPDLSYNADILLEAVDKAGNEVTFRVISHQVGRDGTYKTCTREINLTADNATNETLTIGDVTIGGLRLVHADDITVGDRMVYHVTAEARAGDQQVVLQGNHVTDPTRSFTRSVVLDDEISFPRDLKLGFFNIDSDSGDWNSADLTLRLRGLRDGEAATFETGINFDTGKTGIFQILRNLAADLERVVVNNSGGGVENLDSDLLGGSVYQAISQRVVEIDAKFSYLLDAQARVGARVNRLDMQTNRLNEAQVTYTDLLSKVEDADLAEVIMELTSQENVYRASLATGARIIMPSLVDFLR